MATTLNPGEEAQLGQTIEMFEVITQSQPQDYQSLEILKEAYNKLGREKDVINTSKRIAQAYVQMGQLSSAILEYETVLQRFPDDPDVRAALAEIESRASNFPAEAAAPLTEAPPTPQAPAARTGDTTLRPNASAPAGEVDDGRKAMQKVFVDSRQITKADFDLCWTTPDTMLSPGDVVEPFVQLLEIKANFPIEKSLRLLADKCRAGMIPLEKYDVDMELARTFPVDVCRRWCVLPFDRMSKTVLVATANPFNNQAAKELAAATHFRVLWYLATPDQIVKNLRKAFR